MSLDQGPFFFVEKSLARARIETPLEIIPIKKDKDVKDVLAAKGILRGKGGMEFDVTPCGRLRALEGHCSAMTVCDVSSLIRT